MYKYLGTVHRSSPEPSQFANHLLPNSCQIFIFHQVLYAIFVSHSQNKIYVQYSMTK